MFVEFVNVVLKNISLVGFVECGQFIQHYVNEQGPSNLKHRSWLYFSIKLHYLELKQGDLL
jgi:hypothetical protein